LNQNNINRKGLNKMDIKEIKNLSFTELEDFIGDEFTTLKKEYEIKAIDDIDFWASVENLFNETIKAELNSFEI
tara:strand:+ start:695 stop:916 length:222 start_codon:yes stop_codon:yes gene_type:complete